MSHGDPQKWHLPGWRIEQRYAPGVLIGNWGEDRYTFQKGNHSHNSTHRYDFKHYGSYRPDVVLRRKAMLQNDGLGKEQIFYHHGKRYSNNLISWYDEHYNKRERDENNKLPDLRSWDSHQLAWLPEKSDYPIQGEGTNFGLLGKLQSKWADEIADETRGDYHTTYSGSYKGFPRDTLVNRRYATAYDRSTTLLPFNKTNKDLALRNAPILRQPEIIPSIKPASAHPAIPAHTATQSS